MVKSIERFFPIIDIGLAMLAGALWYVRPQIGLAPFGLLVLAALVRWLVYGYPTRATPFDLPILLFLITAFIAASIAHNQGVEWSQHLTPLEWAWGKYYYIIGAIGLYYAIANLRTIDQVWWFVRAYALFGTIVAIYFLLTNDWLARGVKFDLLTQIGVWLSTWRPEIAGHRLHPNVAGGIMAIVMPFCVPLLAEARSRKQRGLVALWSAAALVMLAGWIMASSRGAWLALALVMVGWYLAWHIADRTQPRRWIGWVMPALVIGLSAWLLFIGAGDWLGNGWQVYGANVVLSRWELLTGSLSLARDYFFTGGGLGAFPMLFSTYYLLVPVFYVIYSHNLFLDILIEQGIIGLLSYLWLVGAFFWMTIFALRHLSADHSIQAESVTRLRWILQATLASLLVMLIHGIVDDIPYGSRALLLMLVPMGMIAALAPHLARVDLRPLGSLAPLAIAVVALGLIWQRDAVIGAWYANLGAVAQARVELQQWSFPERIPEMMRRTPALAPAEQNYREALRFDSGNLTANQRLGMIALTRGDFDAAQMYVETARGSNSADPLTMRLKANLYIAQGRKTEACQIAARAQALGLGGPWTFAMPECAVQR